MDELGDILKALALRISTLEEMLIRKGVVDKKELNDEIMNQYKIMTEKYDK